MRDVSLQDQRSSILYPRFSWWFCTFTRRLRIKVLYQANHNAFVFYFGAREYDDSSRRSSRLPGYLISHTLSRKPRYCPSYPWRRFKGHPGRCLEREELEAYQADRLVLSQSSGFWFAGLVREAYFFNFSSTIRDTIFSKMAKSPPEVPAK